LSLEARRGYLYWTEVVEGEQYDAIVYSGNYVVVELRLDCKCTDTRNEYRIIIVCRMLLPILEPRQSRINKQNSSI